jgi:hypothetical protein
MTLTAIFVTIGAVVAWLVWPIVTGSLLRTTRVSADAATVLLIARTPVVAGIVVLLTGGELWIVLLVVAATGLGGWLLAPYLRDVMADVPRREAAPSSPDFRER